MFERITSFTNIRSRTRRAPETHDREDSGRDIGAKLASVPDGQRILADLYLRGATMEAQSFFGYSVRLAQGFGMRPAVADSALNRLVELGFLNWKQRDDGMRDTDLFLLDTSASKYALNSLRPPKK